MAHFLTDKRTMEVLPYEVDFSPVLSDSDTVLDPVKTTVKIVDSAGKDQTGSILQKATFSGTVVTLVLKDGIDGEDYTIYVMGQGDVSYLTNQPVRVIEMRVRDTLVGNI